MFQHPLCVYFGHVCESCIYIPGHLFVVVVAALTRCWTLYIFQEPVGYPACTSGTCVLVAFAGHVLGSIGRGQSCSLSTKAVSRRTMRATRRESGYIPTWRWKAHGSLISSNHLVASYPALYLTAHLNSDALRCWFIPPSSIFLTLSLLNIFEKILFFFKDWFFFFYIRMFLA